MIACPKYIAEFIGTFALVFAGTGAIIINDVTGGAVTNVGVGLTFGMIVMTMIYAVGDVSGAHFNPAVTLGFFVARRFEGKLILPYVLSQLSGALVASLLLRGLFPQHATLGATAPAGPALQSLILEIILTALLMFCDSQRLRRRQGTRNYRRNRRWVGHRAGSAFAGPICGASMNPARSFAPALVSQHLTNLWIYLIAPVTGALIAVAGCRCVPKDCCSVPLGGMIDDPS